MVRTDKQKNKDVRIKRYDKSKLGNINDCQCRVSLMSAKKTDSKFEASKKIKYGGLPAAAWDLFTDFSSNSTVHGVKYFGERHRHWVERIFWIFAFLLSIYGCSIMVFNIYEKWRASPVIVSTPVWQIPFPAITICSETKAVKNKISFTDAFWAFTNNRTDLTLNELRALEALAQICVPDLLSDDKIGSGLKTHEIVPLLKSMTSQLDETAYSCIWRNEQRHSCDEYLEEVITEEGFCYTFNLLDSKDVFKEDILSEDYMNLHLQQNVPFAEWTLQDGYKTTNESTYPRRALGPGAQAGFTLVLKLNTSDLDYLCRGPVKGFKVAIHTPGEVSRISKQYFRIPMRQEVIVSLKPNMITNSRGLSDYTPDIRQCYFSEERGLKFFKVYTQANCEFECLVNFTRKQCGCVKFSMPRDRNTSICSLSERRCYESAADGILLSELNESLKSGSDENKRGKTVCNCLPSCTSINYDAEISQSDFEYENFLIAVKAPSNEFSGILLSKLTIFFKESQFITSKRSELYGLTDFMADCGGLLGLFMGVSILSLIEMLYYVTLRLTCNLKNRRKIETKERKNIDYVPGIQIDCSPIRKHEFRKTD